MKAVLHGRLEGSTDGMTVTDTIQRERTTFKLIHHKSNIWVVNSS